MTHPDHRGPVPTAPFRPSAAGRSPASSRPA